MHRHPFRRALPWATAGAVAALGLAWRDCVLTASSALLATYAFYGHMDGRAPWQGWRAALRCYAMGVGGLVAALALLAMVVGYWLGWWQQANDQPILALLVLCIAAALCRLSRRDLPAPCRYDAAVIPVLILATTALQAHAFGMAIAPCLYALLSSAALTHVGWRLAHDTAPALALGDLRV